MSSPDPINRYGSEQRLLARFENGARPADFTPAERVQLREALVRSEHYRNPRSPHHEKLSADVRDLFRLDAGADLMDAGLGTTFSPSGNDQAQNPGQADSLFRS
jgi:hypothetical protein